VIASNFAGSGAPATSAAVNVPTPPPTGGGSPPPGGGSPPPPKPGAPKLIAPPVLSGSALPGHTLTCSRGTWSNDPTSFAYAWLRDGSAIAGATGTTYVVEIADEARELSCSVTATGAGGRAAPATSAPVLVAVHGTLHCPAPTGRLHGTAVGPLSLGQLRSAARRRLPRFGVTYNDLDNFCLFAGWGIRVGYPSVKLLRHVPASVVAKVSGRIVLALTANPFYALNGVRPGMRLSAVARRLHLGKPLRVGRNLWYFAPGRTAVGVLKVRAGVIQEVGIASPLLTRGREAQGRFISSFSGSAP
jgi:hypothetical protein